jgi:hypothetical protein
MVAVHLSDSFVIGKLALAMLLFDDDGDYHCATGENVTEQPRK